MKKEEFSNWQDFKDYCSKHSYREWIYRGQSDSSWKLKSSLLLTFERNEKIRYQNKDRQLKRELYEKEMIDSFKRNSYLFLKWMPPENETFEWLSIMQHYGAPTRLLDFTFSPFIAAFFAISDSKDSGAVYCIKYSTIKAIDKENIDDIEDKYSNMMKSNKILKNTLVALFEPKYPNERLLAQQGIFLIPNSLDYSHQEILDVYDTGDDFIKIIFNHSVFKDAIEDLYKMNIDYKLLFPGFEGFCKTYKNIGIIPIGRHRRISDLP